MFDLHRAVVRRVSVFMLDPRLHLGREARAVQGIRRCSGTRREQGAALRLAELRAAERCPGRRT